MWPTSHTGKKDGINASRTAPIAETPEQPQGKELPRCLTPQHRYGKNRDVRGHDNLPRGRAQGLAFRQAGANQEVQPRFADAGKPPFSRPLRASRPSFDTPPDAGRGLGGRHKSRFAKIREQGIEARKPGLCEHCGEGSNPCTDTTKGPYGDQNVVTIRQSENRLMTRRNYQTPPAGGKGIQLRR